ncbi:hypothetical protein ACVWWG_007690 [Bradyrhizobium sp. LB7.2]
MTDAIRPLIAGNWKMNGLKGSTAEFDAMLNGAAEVAGKADLLVCPPATLIAAFAEKARGKKVAVGAQDCHPKAVRRPYRRHRRRNAGGCGRDRHHCRPFRAPRRPR